MSACTWPKSIGLSTELHRGVRPAAGSISTKEYTRHCQPQPAAGTEQTTSTVVCLQRSDVSCSWQSTAVLTACQLSVCLFYCVVLCCCCIFSCLDLLRVEEETQTCTHLLTFTDEVESFSAEAVLVPEIYIWELTNLLVCYTVSITDIEKVVYFAAVFEGNRAF